MIEFEIENAKYHPGYLTDGYVITTFAFGNYAVVGYVKDNAEQCIAELQQLCELYDISDWGLLLKNTIAEQETIKILNRYR